MGKKRKSEGLGTDEQHQSKKIRQLSQNGPASHDTTSETVHLHQVARHQNDEKRLFEYRMAQMEQLTSQILESQQSIKLLIGSAGGDAANAARELNRTLNRTNKSSNDRAKTSKPTRTGTQPDTIKAETINGHKYRPLPNPSILSVPPLPRITDANLANLPFTHQGVVVDKEHSRVDASYERLEFLGDAYIEIVATRLVWDHFRDLPPGRLSQIRELLVKNETLAEYSVVYGFDRNVSAPRNVTTQPKLWTKIKGDIFEAYVAAVILSDPVNGFETAENWLTRLWTPKLAGLETSRPNIHAKQELAQKIQGKGIKISYIDESPPAKLDGGMQTYFIGVYLTGWGWENQHLGSGKGLNKTGAGNEAASKALVNTPLIHDIAAVKREHDAKRRAEKEKENGIKQEGETE